MSVHKLQPNGTNATDNPDRLASVDVPALISDVTSWTGGLGGPLGWERDGESGRARGQGNALARDVGVGYSRVRTLWTVILTLGFMHISVHDFLR